MRPPVLLLIFGFLAVYLCNGRPHPESDCVPAPYTAWSIVRHGSFDLRYYPELERFLGTCIMKLPGGAWVTRYPPGSAIAAVPFVAPFAILHAQPPSGNTMLMIGKLAAALAVACAATLFFLICRRLVPKAVWPATLLFAFGTCLYSVASQALWMHGPATLWLCCALYFLVREELSARDAMLAGLALGFAVFTRPTTAFFAMATWLTLLAQRRWRGLGWLTLGGAIPLVFICLLNWMQFGNAIKGGYVYDHWDSPPPLWLGLSGLIIAPSRGVFIYSPALLLLPWGIARLLRFAKPAEDSPEDSQGRLWRASRGLVIAWLLAAVVTLVFYAHWWDWSGEWCYGPRLLCETMPVLCLVVGLGFEKLRPALGRRIAWGLISLSIAIHFIGIFGNKGAAAWHERHTREDQGRSLFELHDTQIGQHAISLIGEFTKKRR